VRDEQQPNAKIIWLAKGKMLLALHRPEDALQACERSLVLDATFAPAWWGQGDALLDLDRAAEATAQRRQPRSGGNRAAEALEAYQQAVQLAPPNGRRRGLARDEHS
jgi:tetratricopeptide (TPR) repeat protein